MKITYNKNPLCSIIELDDVEKELLRLKVKLEEYDEIIFSAWCSLEDNNIADLRVKLDPNRRSSEKFEHRVVELTNHYIDELKLSHAGDCTCIPCSCSKCRAEELIGQSTLTPFPGKHVLAKIDYAFGKNNERSFSEALKILAEYEPVRSSLWEKYPIEEFNKYIPQWKEEARLAHDYLENYGNDHPEVKMI
jgi:hypothetical protein